MGISERQWILKTPADPEKAAQLAAELGIDRVLADLLVQRGVETFDQARSFFRPRLEDLHDPFLMTDMDKAVERLHTAITQGQKILVYGDYDVDGTTAVAQVYSFIKRFTQQVDFYIPDRYDEGYGLSYKALDWAGDNDVDLVITLDCGIKAIDKVEYARTKGIEVIICDHHLPEDELPGAVAILDPK
ncbi:MAG: DHH family phosphoesterase, partial [Bacteroidales bacterium]|nr:DHH family phosphoesterase [Bacteroidales bacterium]